MTRVKICGLTNLADAQVAVEAGADFLGFIFYEPSPRYVQPDRVREIVAEIKRSAVSRQPSAEDNPPLFVGVFVNESLERVQHTLNFCDLDAAQLHGDEPPEMLAALSGRAYKALRPLSQADLEQAINSYQFKPTNPASSLLPSFLLDAYHPTLYGGTGRVTDWSLAAQVAQRHTLLLAGSLTPDNVAEAVRTVRPWGVDVSSGVEAEKGRKDHQKVHDFIKNLRTG